MADNGRIDYDITIDAARASAELERVRNQTSKLTDSLNDAVQRIDRSITAMTADLRKALSQASGDAERLVRITRRLQAAEGSLLGSASRGEFKGTRYTNAAAQQIISETRAAADNVTARLTNELVNQFSQRMRTLDKVVDARIRAETARINNFMARTTPEMLQAQSILQQRNNDRILREARYGRAAVINENVLERFNANGGADIMGIQGRIMGNAMALAAVFNTMRNGTRFVIELDKQFRQFQAITATTNAEMGELEKHLISVSEKTKFTALEVAEAATIMGQAGLSAKEVGDSIEAVTLLATAAGTNLTEAVDISTSVLSIFNLQTREMANVSNVLTAALNMSKLTLDKLTLGMQYSGNTAAQLGMTYQELVGVLGALANSGIRSGSTLGTGLRQLLIDIQNPSDDLKALLRQSGLTEEDINVETQGFLTVLNNLKEAGIGAAQAFEIFQVRSAAAYVALSNNIDLAQKLQEEFLLTSAAVEANATQMMSLQNRIDVFASVAGTLAYKAFKPMMDVMGDVIKTASEMMSKLKEVPYLFEAIGIAISGIATATVLSAFGAIVRSIGTMIPLFQTFRTGAAAAGVAVAGTGAAVATTTGLLSRLFAVIRGHPILMIVSALAMVAQGLGVFGDAAQDTETRLDALKGRINELQGEIDAIKTQSSAIDQTIENLVKQKASLDAQPLMRQTKILEVVLAFEELAGKIDYTTSSVDELIDALNELKAIDLGKSVPAFEGLIETQKALLAQLDLKIAEMTTKGLFRKAVEKEEAGAFSLFGKAMTSGEVRARYNKISPEAGLIAEMLLPKTSNKSAVFPTDLTGALSVQGSLDALLGRREKELIELKAQRDVYGQKLTEEQEAHLAQLQDEIGLLEVMKAQVAERVNIVKQRAAAEASITRAEEERLQAVVQSHPMFTEYRGALNRIKAEAQGDLSELAKKAPTMTIKEQLDGVKAIEANMKARIATLQEQVAMFMVEMQKSHPEIDQARIRTIVQNEEDSILASLLLKIKSDSEEMGETFKKMTQAQLKDDKKTIEKTIDSLMKQARRATSQNDLDLLRERIRQQYELIREIDRQLFNLDMNGNIDPTKKLEIASELRNTQERTRIALQNNMEALDEMQAKLIEEHYKALQDAVDDEAKAITKKVRELNQKIAKSSPGAALDALIQQVEELMRRLSELQGKSSIYGLSQDTDTFVDAAAQPLPNSTMERADRAMRYYMEQGLPKHIAAGIVSNLMAESNLNPAIVGDKGTSFGIAQWHKERFYQGLVPFAKSLGKDWRDFETQLAYVMHELKNGGTGFNDKTVLPKLMNTQTAQEASSLFMRLYEKPNPKFANESLRVGYAKTLAGNDYHTQQQNIEGLQNDTIDAHNKAVERGIKQTASAIVGNATKQIAALVAQAKASPDPEVVGQITKDVNELYKKIIKERSDEFDQLNAEAIGNNDPDVLAQREEMLAGIRAAQNQKIAALLNEYFQKLDEKLTAPLKDAQARLDAAQQPENAGKFTSLQLREMENDVRMAERQVAVQQLANAEKMLATIREYGAQAVKEYGEHSAEATFWLNEEARAKERIADLSRQVNAENAAAAATGPSVAQAIQAANVQWGIQAGLLRQNAQSMQDLIPLAEQVGNAWGSILDGLANNFTQLFMDLAEGTMSAEEAFKKFALSTIQMFMQMIARALAYQLVLAAIGDNKGGGGIFGGLMTGLLGVPGMATGGEVRGGVPTRDSVVRSLMPGEFVVRSSAVKAIGEDTLTAINNNGNRIISNGIAPLPSNDNNKEGVPQTLNIWVVTPDQQPPPGPNDIVAAVADNINRRGSLKALIKQVQTGTI